ncbi:ATP-binding protein [Streptomyces sp. NPDC002206]
MPDDVCAPGALVAEILGVLLDNARVHGRGAVRLTVRDLDDALAFDVTDEGEVDGETTRFFDRGHTGDGTGEGIGLALAHDLAASLGGRLSLTSRRPTGFTLLVPVRQDKAGGTSG